MITTHTLKLSNKERPRLTTEQIAQIEARAPRDEDIAYDEDCPPSTDEQLRRFKRANYSNGPREKASGDTIKL